MIIKYDLFMTLFKGFGVKNEISKTFIQLDNAVINPTYSCSFTYCNCTR